MTPLKFVGVVFVVLIAAVLAIGGFFTNRVNSTLQEECDLIVQIARDEKAVAYLDNWASEHVLDKGYYFASGNHGRISATSSSGSTYIHPLPDEKQSGIEEILLRFSADKVSNEFQAPITSDNVNQIVFGRGRNSIIFLKNGHSLQSHQGHDESSGHLLKIDDSLFAYCPDAMIIM